MSALSCAAHGRANGRSARLTVARVRAGDPAYVEFRQRPSRQLLPGHMYVVFGRLDKTGEPLTRHFIGLDPQHYLRDAHLSADHSVRAEVTPSGKDCTFPVANAYRVSLTAMQYKRLLAKAKAALARPPRWSLRYNCHNFAAELGSVAGLKPGGNGVVPSVVYFWSFIRANEQTR
ncbi:MAG: hypothetical protein IPL47_03320 [Phyllobacteriaceae bacterium]|nr:hypothetical protein [Phyllobacteriaceae bacterium]